jgi:4-hydroxybenzoate polyprenyltransferase
VIWNWFVLLVSVLANQKSVEGAMEDAINKPWRPIPSGRITRAQATTLQLFVMPVGIGVNYLLGAWEETALVYNLAWMYNDLGGGDNWIIRNVILALALSQFNKGGMRVAAEMGFDIPASSWWWIFITSAVIGTTMQAQDMKDQEGDRARRRSTAPLVLGDGPARWTIAVPVMIWSVVCPFFWGLGIVGYVLPVGVGTLVSFRFLMLRGFWADKKTWWLWTFWTAIIWFVPLFKNYGVFVRCGQNFRL